MKRNLISISELASMLAGQIDTLVAEILPNGKREGNEWRVGSLAGEPGRSLAVNLSAARAGVWSDFCSGECGDALELVAAVLFRGDKGDAVKWAKSWLGLDNADPARIEQQRRVNQENQSQRKLKAKQDEERIHRIARGLWHNADPKILGTPVYEYLLARGIDLKRLPKLPGSIRYSPDCWCDEVQRKMPAMVTAIMNADGQHIATHRTYLQLGQPVQKAKLIDAKKTLAPYRGGFISLNRGASSKPLKAAPAGDKVIICEGIEDGLSLALACPEYRVIAAVSLSNFRNIELPEIIKDVIIAADNDQGNIKAMDSLDVAISHFMRQGRRVSIARSSVGKDFNDLLQANRGTITAARAAGGAA